MIQQNSINLQGLPVELLNELFASMPFGNAFGLLAKMANGILARNIQKMENGIKEEMRKNKMNVGNCGSKLSISANGLEVKHSGPEQGVNCVRAALPIPTYNLKNINNPIISFYYEMEILNLDDGIDIGLCDQQFPLEGRELGEIKNSIGIYGKKYLWIDDEFIEFENADEYFNNGNIVGFGTIHHPNSMMECFVTWNSKLLGKATLPRKFADIQLFPAISFRGPGDSIHVNLGKEEWHFKNFKSIIELNKNLCDEEKKHLSIW